MVHGLARFLTLCSLVVSLMTRPAPGVCQTHGTSGADFLKIRMSARALGMGGAFVGLADDASALFWNPAGLSRLYGWHASVTHSEWLADLRLESFSMTLPDVGESYRLGLFGLQLWSPPWDNTGGKLPAETYSDLLIGGALATELIEGFHVGGSAKLLRRSLGRDDAFAAGFDMGLLYAPDEHWSAGISVQNLGRGVELGGERFSLPLTVAAGAAFALEPAAWLRATAVGQITYDRLRSWWRPSIGCEFEVARLISLRAGLDLGSPTNVALGMGVRWRWVNIDYSFLPHGFSVGGLGHPLASMQAGMTARRVAPGPFHLVSPGLPAEVVVDLRGVLLAAASRGSDASAYLAALVEASRNKAPHVHKEALADFCVFLDEGEALEFVWTRPRVIGTRKELRYEICVTRLEDEQEALAGGFAWEDVSGAPGTHPVTRAILKRSETRSAGNFLLHTISASEEQLPGGRYVWTVSASLPGGGNRTARGRYRVFSLFYRRPPAPVAPRNGELIQSDLALSRAEGGPQAEGFTVGLRWRPALLGLGEPTYRVYVRRLDQAGDFSKVYEGRATRCSLTVPYVEVPVTYVWYVEAELGGVVKTSERSRFQVLPVAFEAPVNFVPVVAGWDVGIGKRIEETVRAEEVPLPPDSTALGVLLPPQAWRAMAEMEPTLLRTEERNEVILDRPFIPMLFFESGSAEPDSYSVAEFTAVLDSLVAHLRRNPDVLLRLRGYVDRNSDGVADRQALELSKARAARIGEMILSVGPDLASRVIVDTLSLDAVFEPRIVETTHDPTELQLIEAENRRVMLEAVLTKPFERNLSGTSDLNRMSTSSQRIGEILSRNPDVTLEVGAGSISELVSAVRSLAVGSVRFERIYPYLSAKDAHGVRISLSADKLLYKPTMPKIIRSKLGLSYLSVRLDSLHLPGPFRWRLALLPWRSVVDGVLGGEIVVDSGYVAEGYENYRCQVNWRSSEPLALRWNPENPYVLALDVSLERPKVRRRFVRPVRFEPRQQHVQTYRMVLIQHVFASAASEARFLEVRVKDILEQILALRPHTIEGAMISGHACAIGGDQYNRSLSLNRARHTWDVLKRQLDVLVALGRHAEEARRLRRAFEGRLVGYGYWEPYRFEPEFLFPGIREDFRIVRRLNRWPLQRVRNRRTEIQLTVKY